MIGIYFFKYLLSRDISQSMRKIWLKILLNILCLPCYRLYYALIQQKTFYCFSLIKLKAKTLTDKNFINCFKNITRTFP